MAGVLQLVGAATDAVGWPLLFATVIVTAEYTVYSQRCLSCSKTVLCLFDRLLCYAVISWSLNGDDDGKMVGLVGDAGRRRESSSVRSSSIKGRQAGVVDAKEKSPGRG